MTNKQQLRFEPEGHKYFLGDEELPNVTSVLGLVVDLSHIPTQLLEFAATRGDYVHQACTFLDRGTLDWDDLDPMLVPYVKAYEKFKKDTGFVPELIEHRGYSSRFKYAGTLDRTGPMQRRKVLLDIKSGFLSPATALQVAAYSEMDEVKERGPYPERYGLQLMDTGKYKLSDPYTSPNDFNVFLGLLTGYRVKLENM